MQINFPRIVRPIDLGDFTPEMEGRVFVWVNPPSGDLDVMLKNNAITRDKETTQEAKDEAQNIVFAHLSNILSQGEPDTHISVKEIKRIYAKAREHEPMFWLWFMTQILTEINDHRLQRKKV